MAQWTQPMVISQVLEHIIGMDTWLLIELSHSFSGLLKKDCYGEMDNFNQMVANGS